MSEYCTCATSFDGSCQLHDRIDALTAENLSLREQVAALESREVCTVAHENVETCGYCQRDALTAENAALRDERALLVQRAENAEAALVEAEQEYQDARIVRKQLEARLAEATVTEANLHKRINEWAAHCEVVEARLAEADERHSRYVKGVGELADRAARVSEIIAYCAQEGHDGEPYDTINAIATGEYSTRGGGNP